MKRVDLHNTNLKHYSCYIPPVHIGDAEYLVSDATKSHHRVSACFRVTKMTPDYRCVTYITSSVEVIELLDSTFARFEGQVEYYKEALDKIKSYTFIQRLKFLFKGEINEGS